MIKLILIFSFISLFNFKYKNKQFSLLNESDQNNDYSNENKTKDIFVLPIDFGSMIEDFDSMAIENLIHKLPKAPETEDEIIDDSFEGFLRREFLLLAPSSKKINFQTFYFWKKKAGIILTEEELEQIYYTIVEKDNLCGLMEFITINKIIDEENNGSF
jgi:hypothetical protein